MDNKINVRADRRALVQDEDNGLHCAIRQSLFSSRVVGMLPLAGLMHEKSDKLRFTLRTPYTLLYAFSIFGQLLMFVVTLCLIAEYGITYSNITRFLFYTTNFVSTLVLFNIARSWPQFVAKVEVLEAKLPRLKRHVVKMSNITLVFILLFALIEHSLSVWYGMSLAYSCASDSAFQTYCHLNMPWIKYTGFSLWKSLLSEVFILQSTFMWSYSDLLLMIISIYLAEHFVIHHELLKTAVKQENFSLDELRTQYLKIVRIVRLVNKHFGIYILTSFGTNLYWICTQLFYSINKSNSKKFNIICPVMNPKYISLNYGLEHTIYFTYSFSFLTLRTLLVLFLSARINTVSKVPLCILYEIPSAMFNVEVQRYIAQIKNIKVAMSGLDLFYVTRPTILTLLGTIVTYELVLLQYNN